MKILKYNALTKVVYQISSGLDSKRDYKTILYHI